MNKIFISFSAICDDLQESMISLADITAASMLVFNCSRSYWDRDGSVPTGFLTPIERDTYDEERDQTWITFDKLPPTVVRRWKDLQESIRYVDSRKCDLITVTSKDEWRRWGYLDYYQYAEALSTQGTFVFMGANLWVPRARNFLRFKHNDALLNILSGGLTKNELCVLIEKHPELWKQYEELVDYLPFWDPIPSSGKTAEATV